MEIDPTAPAKVVTLNYYNYWKDSFNDLPTSGSDGGKKYTYTYGIREIDVPEGFELTGYYDASDNEISRSSLDTGANKATEALAVDSTVTVKNTESTPSKGSLKLTKLVKVNGVAVTATPSDDEKALVDGTYTFTITGPTDAAAADQITKTVTITFKDGVANSAEGGTLDANGVVTVDDLTPGSYTVEETATSNDLSLIDTQVTTGTGTVSENIATVTVSAGSTATVPTVAFTNNVDTTELYVHKRFQLNSQSVKNWKKDYGADLPDYATKKVYFWLYKGEEKVDEYGRPNPEKPFELEYGDTISSPIRYVEEGEEWVARGETLYFAKMFNTLPAGFNYKIAECDSTGNHVFAENEADVPYMTCVESDTPMEGEQSNGKSMSVLKNYYTNAVAMKQWNDGTNTVSTHPDVTFKLQKSTDNGGTWTDVKNSDGTPATLILSEVHSGGNYQYHDKGERDATGTPQDYPFVEWNYLPRWDFTEWTAIQYRAVEVDATEIVGYKPVVSGNKKQNGNDIEGDAEANESLREVFENKLKMVDLYVKKQWKAGDVAYDNNDLPDWIPDEINFTVMRVEYEDAALTRLVNEDAADGFALDRAGDIYKLTRTEEYAARTINNLPTCKVNYDAEKDFYLTYYSYYVVETGKDGYTVTYQVDGGEVVSTGKDAEVKLFPDNKNGVTMINTEDTTDVDAKKQWGSPETEWPTDVESVEFTLYATVDGKTAPISDATAFDDIKDWFDAYRGVEPAKQATVVLTDTSTTAEWSNLPQHVYIDVSETTEDEATGEVSTVITRTWYPVTYTVVETKVTYTNASGKEELKDADAIKAAYGATWDADSKKIINSENTTEIVVSKKWVGVGTTDWPKDSHNADIPITLTLRKRTGENGEHEHADDVAKFSVISETNSEAISGLNGATVTVSAKDGDNAYKITISGLEKTGTVTTSTPDTFTGELDWYVVETQVSGYGVPKYTIGSTTETRDDGAHKGDVITNEIVTYELPSTGGPGTTIFYGAGISLMLFAFLGFVLNARKRSARNGI